MSEALVAHSDSLSNATITRGNFIATAVEMGLDSPRQVAEHACTIANSIDRVPYTRLKKLLISSGAFTSKDFNVAYQLYLRSKEIGELVTDEREPQAAAPAETHTLPLANIAINMVMQDTSNERIDTPALMPVASEPMSQPYQNIASEDALNGVPKAEKLDTSEFITKKLIEAAEAKGLLALEDAVLLMRLFKLSETELTETELMQIAKVGMVLIEAASTIEHPGKRGKKEARDADLLFRLILGGARAESGQALPVPRAELTAAMKRPPIYRDTYRLPRSKIDALLALRLGEAFDVLSAQFNSGSHQR